MIELVEAKVTSLDVDFHEVTWEVAPTGEDVLDYETHVLRSEAEEGPFDDLTGPLVDRYHFIDNIIQIQNRWRRYHYLLRVVRRGTDESRDFGPISNEPQPDLLAMELRRHIRLLFTEFAGRRCMVLPARTFGQRCFLPGAHIQGPVIGASKAFYNGEAVELLTAKGLRLSVTANHPILTAEGFVPAKSVRVGDYAVCYSREAGVCLPTPGAQGYEQESPALPQDVFGSLSKRFVSQTARAVGHDFHGEAQRFIGDIEVVGSYGDLLLHVEPTGSEHLSDLLLEQPYLSQFGLMGFGSTDALFKRNNPPPGGVMRRRNHVGALLGGSSFPGQVAGFANSTKPYAPLLECMGNGATRNPELVGQLLDRRTGLVALDKIVGVRKFNYLGHVYDFETTTGWVVANNILTSNCSCYNKLLDKRTRSGCVTCYDTGWVRGYLHPIESWIQVDPSAKTKQVTGTGSVTQQDNTTMRMGYYPAIKPGDLIIEAENKRWRVIQQNQTEHSRAPVHQELQVHRIPEKDIEFRIPVEFSDALPNLYFTPRRNFTNPTNMENADGDKGPGIFSIYRY